MKIDIMKGTKLKQFILGISALLLLSVVTLFFHIYHVTHHHTAQLQLGRIDFKQIINSEEALRIQGFVSKLPGINNTHFNTDNGVLVYTFVSEKQSTKNVYDKLLTYGHYKAERYVTSAEEAAKGCPAFANNGLRGKIIAFIASL